MDELRALVSEFLTVNPWSYAPGESETQAERFHREATQLMEKEKMSARMNMIDFVNEFISAPVDLGRRLIEEGDYPRHYCPFNYFDDKGALVPETHEATLAQFIAADAPTDLEERPYYLFITLAMLNGLFLYAKEDWDIVCVNFPQINRQIHNIVDYIAGDLDRVEEMEEWHKYRILSELTGIAESIRAWNYELMDETKRELAGQTKGR